MLSHLHIKNFTLIDVLDIDFQNGFSVITGETGAGKSIIIDAIGLLLGQRADNKTIKQGRDKCIIEAHFNLSKYKMESFFNKNDIEFDSEDTIIRRELSSNGKSRAFINDSPVQLAILKELGEQLIDIHSQHHNLLLSKQDFQLDVVDIIAGNEDNLKNYRKSFKNLQSLARELKDKEEEINRNKNNYEFLKFQYDELSNERLVAGEQEDLEQKAQTMTHAEDIKNALYETYTLLSEDNSGVVEQLRNAKNAIENITDLLPLAKEIKDRLESCNIELKDIAQEIGSQMDSTEFDPKELDAINDRLDRIYTLQKKHQCTTVEDLIEKQNILKSQIDAIDNSDFSLEMIRKELEKAEASCKTDAEKLSSERKKAAAVIEKEIAQRLTLLEMPNAKFKITAATTEFNINGSDKISFLFSANKSSQLQPVSAVASGGEIARVMLSLKSMISGAVKLPTIIFDEIDTGVSGKTAEKMAILMKEMGDNGRQVISITHLPQIAALGTEHYKVSKQDTADGTVSKMTKLNSENRIIEIAQMLSGSDITEAAIHNAKELLKI